MPDANQLAADPQTSTPAPASDTLNPASDPPKVEAPALTPAPAPAVDFNPEWPGSTPDAPYGFKANGEPRKDPRGRKPKAATRVDPLSVTPNPRPRQANAPIASPTAIAVDYDALGKMAANAWFGAGVVIFGREWEPNAEQGEHVAVKDAFRDYFQSKQIQRIDPGVQLAIVLGSYSLVRVQKPTIRSRLAQGWEWIKNRLRREP